MEIKTTLKKRVIIDKVDYKHFHAFSNITTGLDYNEECAVTMIKYYYNDEHKAKSATPPYKQRFIPCMINKHHNDMTKLTKRAG
eukprot:883251-Amphidinium_carterae.1